MKAEIKKPDNFKDYPPHVRYLSLPGPMEETGQTFAHPVSAKAGAIVNVGGPSPGKWTNERLAKIGDRVKVTFNQFGAGEVIGFFTDGGNAAKEELPFAGVQVLIDNPPDWFKKQHPGINVIHVYGAEIRFI